MLTEIIYIFFYLEEQACRERVGGMLIENIYFFLFRTAGMQGESR
jgi:hypothetical protein